MAYKNIELNVLITAVKRDQNSKNGNPRFTLVTDLGDFKTASDMGWAYALNPVEDVKKLAKITINGRGTISDLDLITR